MLNKMLKDKLQLQTGVQQRGWHMLEHCSDKRIQ